jgi:hypothetical protein
MKEQLKYKSDRTYVFLISELKRKLAENNITLKELADTLNTDEKLISALFDKDIIDVINKMLITFNIPIRTYKKSFSTYKVLKRNSNYFIKRQVTPLAYIHWDGATQSFDKFHLRKKRGNRKFISRIEKQLILNEMRDALKEYFKNNPPDTHFV